MPSESQQARRSPAALVYAPKPGAILTSLFEAFPGGASRSTLTRKVEGLLKQELRCLSEHVTLGGREVKPVAEVITSTGMLILVLCRHECVLASRSEWRIIAYAAAC